jgi:hypothetical protein
MNKEDERKVKEVVGTLGEVAIGVLITGTMFAFFPFAPHIFRETKHVVHEIEKWKKE